MLDTTPEGALAALVADLERALVAQDADAVAELFLETGFWRDLAAFTWNLKTCEGRDQIAEMARAQLPRIAPKALSLDPAETVTEAGGVTEGWLVIETAVGRGQGYIRMKDGKIWTLLTTLHELKGHEEPRRFRRPMGAEHGHDPKRQTWKEKREAEAARLGHEEQPYVLVIGGGQGGIALGARLRQLSVPTIVIDKHPRPGDQWRNRYKSLCLHDPV
ncbi:MAG: NAD(P)/FAD-dependent oxidoreductase, partial [Gemmobacter sp.]